MKKSSLTWLLLAGLIFLWVPDSAHSELIYEQLPDSATGAFYYSDYDHTYTSADNFTLDSEWTISQVEWYGRYAGSNTLPLEANFTINFYEDGGGTVGNLIQSFSVGSDVVFEDVGLLSGMPTYKITTTATEGLTLLQGTYWIAINENTTGNSDTFTWLSSTDGDNVHFIWGYGSYIDDLSFAIYSLVALLELEPEPGFTDLHTSAPMVSFEMMDSFQNTTSARMLHLRQSNHKAFALKDPLDGLMLASAGDVQDIGPITGDGERNKNFWGKLYGVTGDVDGNDTLAGYDYSIGGFTLGADFEAFDNTFIGVMAGISSGRADTDLSDSLDVNSYQVGVYTSYVNGPYYLDGIVTYADNDYETSRSTSMGTATGDYGGDEWGLSAEFGYVMSKDDLIFEPFIGTRYIVVDQDDFNEQGADIMNMAIESRDTYSWEVLLGGRLTGVYEQENGSVFVPELNFAYHHELGDDQDVLTANFVNNPAATNFVFEGLDLNRDSVELGVGIGLIQADNVDIDIDLGTELNSDEQAYYASVGLKYSW